jgi:FixJ family two-component response regulator
MSKQTPVVAIVDDDPRLLESLEELLESDGHVVRSFSSAEALLAEGLSELSVLITDIGMPGLSGLELRDLVENVRPDLPVILITGRHEVADRLRAGGMARLFCKPFDGPALLAAVGAAASDGAIGEQR